MSLPHHVFIEFLSSRYPDEEQAVSVLNALELPPFYKNSFHKIRARVIEDAPPRVKAFLNGGSLLNLNPLWKWVKTKRFVQCWAHEPVFSRRHSGGRELYEDVWELLVETPVRSVIDCLLIRKSPYAEINDVLQVRFGKTISADALEGYRKHFFNLSWTTKDEWLHYLRSCGTTRREMLLLAMRTEDEARLRHRLGAPPRFEYSEILSDVMATAYFKFKDHSAEQTAIRAKTWADIMMKAGDRREKFKSQDTVNLKRDLQVEFDYLEMDFPTLQEIEDAS
jgi:hypothetical protein